MDIFDCTNTEYVLTREEVEEAIEGWFETEKDMSFAAMKTSFEPQPDGGYSVTAKLTRKPRKMRK